MKITIQELFDRIKNSNVQKEPFEHLIVDNFLPDEFYKELAKELESDDFANNYERGPYGNIERFGADLTDYKGWKNSGCKITTTTHKGNYQSLLSTNNKNVQMFVDLLLKNEKSFCSLLCSKLRTEKFQDNYFFHINMTKDRTNYTIEPHTDNTENIFTLLFYAPETDCNKDFGLTVYDKNKKVNKRIPFEPNKLIVFAPTDESWHGVDPLTNNLVGTRNSFQMFFYKNSC